MKKHIEVNDDNIIYDFLNNNSEKNKLFEWLRN